MADQLDPVTQRFEAEISDYVAKVQAAADEAQGFAAASEEAKAAMDGVRDHALEAAKATGIYRDSMGRLHAANGAFIKQSAAVGLIMGHLRDEALEEAAALGHLRDEALLAAVGVRELKKEEESASRTGFLSRLLGGINGLGGAIPAGSGLFSLPAILAIVAAVETLLPLAAGLLAGFAAAGAGAGAFALLAIPAFKKVSGAYQQIHADQRAYDRALTATARNTALAHLKKDYAALSEPQRDALSGIQQLSGEWHKMSTAFTPDALKVLGGFLKLAGQLLPDVAPFAKTFADSLTGLLGKASGFAGSKGFSDWLKQFHGLEGPSITAIGNGVGHVATAIGGLLTSMSKKDVVNAINIAFGILTGTINVITGMVKRLMDNWNGMSVAAKHTWYDIKRWTDDVTQAFDRVRHFAAILGHDTAAYFDFMRHHAAILAHDIAAHFGEIRHDIAHWADDVGHYALVVVRWFEQLPGRIVHGLGDLGHLLSNAGAAILRGFLDGLKSGWHDVTNFIGGIAGWISGHKGPLTADQVLLLPHGMAIMAGLTAGLKAGMPNLTAMLASVTWAVKDKLITTSDAFSLTGWLQHDNARLKTLAAERQGIVNQINAARNYAATTASSVAGNYAISGFATTGPMGGAAPVSSIITSLRAGVGQIRKWAGNIKKLAREGLDKAYLGQLIAMGPVAGAALAEELASAGLGDIRAINSAQYQISQASGQVGKLAANLMYDSGAAAGKGFLSGLEAQKKAITQLMEQIAKAMVATLKKELGIASPSTVMRWHALMAGEGIVAGLMDSLGRIRTAASLAAAAAVPGGSRGLGVPSAGGYGSGASMHVTVPVTVHAGAEGAMSPQYLQGLQRAVQEAVLRYGQVNPNNGFTPAWGHG